VRRVIALAAALAALALIPAAASASTPVPDRIQPPAGNTPFLLAHAAGVQVYTCTSTPEGPKWQFTEPKAVLYGDHGQILGTHYAGPTWELKDGSQVKGARVDGVTVDPKAIPWLLLKATPITPGTLAPTTYIQRLATQGGLEPSAATCRTATVGKEQWVPYTADYRFFKEQS
jgi:hypothetical protein